MGFGIPEAIATSAAIALASAGSNAGIQASMNKKTREFTKEFDALKRQRDRVETAYYWDKYNSPQAQMQAFQDAGLNPNLIYDKAGGTSPAASNLSVPEQKAPTLDMSGVSSALNLAANLVMQKKSLEQNAERIDIDRQKLALDNQKFLQSQAESNSRISLNSSRLRLQRLDEEYKDVFNQYYKETRPQERALLGSRLRFIQSQIKNTEFMQGIASQRLGLDWARLNAQQAMFNANLTYDAAKTSSGWKVQSALQSQRLQTEMDKFQAAQQLRKQMFDLNLDYQYDQLVTNAVLAGVRSATDLFKVFGSKGAGRKGYNIYNQPPEYFMNY